MSTILAMLSSLNSEYQERFGQRLQVAFPDLMIMLRSFEKNVKELTCDLCNFTTTSPDISARHKQRPHDKCCGLCDYSAPSQEMVDRHVRGSHAKKLFCDQCLFATTDRHQGTYLYDVPRWRGPRNQNNEGRLRGFDSNKKGALISEHFPDAI